MNRQAPLHIYTREIQKEDRSSLSVLSDLIHEGATVLDLGCGAGALGRYVRNYKGARFDGVTINQAEAELASPHYESVKVANLETTDLPTLFHGRRYDYIVCADVLEHLRTPEHLLEACHQLLKPEGKLLISIPNAAYVGLLAEMLEGDFRYREEGLLDKTHLRFFTRRSILRMLELQKWGAQELHTIHRELTDSEFTIPFDTLPPKVATYLLQIPDALSYQFVIQASPNRPHGHHLMVSEQSPGHALFTANLYLGRNEGYSEDEKISCSGKIGILKQTLQFQLPSGDPLNKLRLDPADRPGFIHFYSIRLADANGKVIWDWLAERDGLSNLVSCSNNDLVFSQFSEPEGVAKILSFAYDPWIELPFDRFLLAQAVSGTLEIELGWPMSADYFVLSEKLRKLDPIAVSKTNRMMLNSHLNNASSAGNYATKPNHTSDSVEAKENSESPTNDVASTKGIESSDLKPKINQLIKQRNLLLNQKQQLQTERNSQNSALAAQTNLNQRLQEEIQELRIKIQTRHKPRSLKSEIISRLKNIFKITSKLKKDLHKDLSEGENFGAGSKLEIPILKHPVDVIVPVYKSLADTQRCIQSVISQRTKNSFRLIIINDCSPEPALCNWLRGIAASDSRISLLENENNLGFVETVNRGMSISDKNDIILLNSDTEVANDWLDRLVRAAYKNDHVGTVTPFSNNATICSYPRFCEVNALPKGYDTTRLDRIFSNSAAGQVVDIPTGVGFCMYIRRDCLNEVGLFDAANFGKGYGEENDFCCRASAAGWRNIHALDTFVFHSGGVSFGASKNEREQAAMQTLRRLHPHYEPIVHEYLKRDPAQSVRHEVDLVRAHESGLPIILAVVHDRTGGTIQHVHELAAHFKNSAIFLQLRPEPEGQVSLTALFPTEGFSYFFKIPEQKSDLLATLQRIKIAHVHYHHLLGHHPEISKIHRNLNVTADFTAHDYYSYCPNISLTNKSDQYCGEKGVESCRSCMQENPKTKNINIDSWRSMNADFLNDVRYILAPSRDAARRIAKFAPTSDVRIAPHTDLLHLDRPTPPEVRVFNSDAVLKIVVIGALSAIKGADQLEAVASEAARIGAPIEFHLLGYAYRDLITQPSNNLTIHGKYNFRDLPTLLKELKADLAWFPAQWPETYSYTLSACLEIGLPVIATDLGAFPERLSHRYWSWIFPWNLTPDQWLNEFIRIRSDNFLKQCPPAIYRDVTDDEYDVFSRKFTYSEDYLNKIRPKQ